MFANSIEPEILRKLRDCKVKLYLTGSRHFGGFKPSSDYDFYCEDTPQNRDEILSLGPFSEEAMSIDSVTYNDSNTSSVWKHWGEVEIHIQFVKNVSLKNRTQAFLKDFPFHEIEKPVRKVVWNWALKKVQG